MLIWQRRSLDFLHTYHHATTFCLFLAVMNFPGAEKCGMLLNGFVHLIMVREVSPHCVVRVASQVHVLAPLRGAMKLRVHVAAWVVHVPGAVS